MLAMRGFALLAVVLLSSVDTLETQGCGSSQAAPGQVFTNEDGVRFQVEVVVNGLEVPWSLVFAPDGRLFVPERPGRVRIVDTVRRTSELAFTLDDEAAVGEGGLLGLAL